MFEFLLVNRNQENRVMFRFSKGRERESLVCISVCGVKVIKSFVASSCTGDMLVKKYISVLGTLPASADIISIGLGTHSFDSQCSLSLFQAPLYLTPSPFTPYIQDPVMLFACVTRSKSMLS